MFFWVILVSTPPCFDHISLIQSWNGVPFFCWSPYSSGNIISKFHNFSQPDGLFGSWFNRIVGLACGALFFVILEPKSYMGRAHKLKLDHGQYCGSILGLGLSYM